MLSGVVDVPCVALNLCTIAKISLEILVHVLRTEMKTQICEEKLKKILGLEVFKVFCVFHVSVESSSSFPCGHCPIVWIL